MVDPTPDSQPESQPQEIVTPPSVVEDGSYSPENRLETLREVLPGRAEVRMDMPQTGEPDTHRRGDRNLPADLRTPLYGFDLIFLAIFYIVSGGVVFLLVSGIAIFIFGVPRDALQDAGATKDSIMIVTQGILSGVTLLFLWALVRSRTATPFWPSVGWHRFRGATSSAVVAARCIFGGLALAVAVGWMSRFFDRDVQLPMEELFRNRQSVLLLMVLGVVVAPAIEETIFRGCIFPVLARRAGMEFGIVFTGILFGLAHAQQLWPGIGQISLLMAVGIVLTYIRARTGTVVASYLVHVSYNSILFAGFYFATGGLHHLPS